MGAGQGLVPGVHLAAGQGGQGVARKQPVAPRRRRGIVAALWVKCVGEMGDHHMRQPLPGRQRSTGGGQVRSQIGAGNCNFGLWIQDVVLQLLGAVHRVDRHHHGIGPQDAEVGNHQLRAVLHIEHHPVARAHA